MFIFLGQTADPKGLLVLCHISGIEYVQRDQIIIANGGGLTTTGDNAIQSFVNTAWAQSESIVFPLGLKNADAWEEDRHTKKKCSPKMKRKQNIQLSFFRFTSLFIYC